MVGDRGDQVGGRGALGAVADEQMPTEPMIVFHQHHPCAEVGGRQCGGHPGRSAAGHHHVGVGVTFVVVAVRGVEIDGAAGRERGQHLLIGRPQAGRFHERLVVEAGGQEAGHCAVGGPHIEVERRPRVLGRDRHPVVDQAVGGSHVGLVADLQPAVRIPVVGGQDPARAVVLHRPGEDALPGPGERRDDGVAPEAADLGAVPGETDRVAAIDEFAGPGRQASAHEREPFGKGSGELSNSFVTVSRSRVK